MKTIEPVTQPAAAPFEGIKRGDTVRVQTRDGATVQFVVQAIEGDTIVQPNGRRYTRDEIVRLQRRSFSYWKTGLFVGGTVLAALVVFAAIIVSDDDFGKWY